MTSKVAGAHVHISLKCQSKNMQRGEVEMFSDFSNCHVAVFQKTGSGSDFFLHQIVFYSSPHLFFEDMRNIAFAVRKRLCDLLDTGGMNVLAIDEL